MLSVLASNEVHFLNILRLSGISMTLSRNVHGNTRRVIKVERDTQFRVDCQTLEVPYDCDEAQVRSSYIRLAKKFHPDSGSQEACKDKFNEVDTAYKNVLKKFAEERHNSQEIEGEYGLYYEEKRKGKVPVTETPDEENEEIEHVAPQHRQYLNFEGVGMGTPGQREKQYRTHRAMKAASNVMEHRVQRALKDIVSEETNLVVKDKKAAKKIKTSSGMERLVEDLIQESMARGDFDNLKGQGKPLPHDRSYNPYIDFTTHKLNEVLIDNGFTPEWIMLEKEIRQEIVDLRRKLSNHRHEFDENLNETEELKWNEYVSNLVPECNALNAKIQKYNLVVPTIFKQIICLQLDKEVANARRTFSPELRKQVSAAKLQAKIDMESSSAVVGSNKQGSFLDFIMSVIKS